MNRLTTADALDLETVRAACVKMAAFQARTVRRLMSHWVSELEPTLLLSAETGAIVGLGIAGDLSLNPQAYVTVEGVFSQ